MSEFGNLFAITLGLTLVMIMGQFAISEATAGEVNINTFYSCKNTFVGNFTNNNDCLSKNNSIKSTLAFQESNNPLKPSTGEGSSNGFTDIFFSAQSWFLSGFGRSYLGQVLLAPYNFLAITGMDLVLVTIIGSVWYSLVFFSFIEWWRGLA